MSTKRAFEYIPLRERPAKPREKSVIEIRGSYYSPVTYTYLSDLFDLMGEKIDGFKFVAGCQRLHPRDEIKRFTKLCHKHNVYVSTGGMIERVLVEGPTAVDAYLIESKKLGFDVVEVSSGFAYQLPLQDKVNITKKVIELGMKAKPEISFMKGAGAGTHVTKYKPTYRKTEDVVAEAKAYLEAGAYKLMFESEGITEDLPPAKWRKDLIKKMVDTFGLNTWMFEASDPAVFKWYLKTFGPDVNLFIDHSQIFEFEAWHDRLWGDPQIWEGKDLKYPGNQATSV